MIIKTLKFCNLIKRRDSTQALLFNTQKVSDTVLKSRLGGWTSDKDPRLLVKSKTLTDFRIKDAFPVSKYFYRCILFNYFN